MELSYQTLKLTHQAREAYEMRTEARRKNLLILMIHYLTQEGYIDAAKALEEETNLGLQRFEVCDNIDLETILMEYESYYFVKFQKYPKMVKKASGTAESNLPPRSGGKNKRVMNDSCQNFPKIYPQRPRPKSTAGKPGDAKSLNKEHPKQDSVNSARVESTDFGLNISKINKDSGEEKAHPQRGQVVDFRGLLTDAIKGATNELALNTFNCNPDPSDIYLHNPNIKWDDIIGLDAAKQLVKEAVVYPIRVLFELARYHAPSTIFLDELESVMSQRGTAPGGEHEGSLRMKTELLVQMDGLARSEDLVFVLAASNLPWELDYAMLRRLEKRILVDLPSQGARQAMIHHWLPPVSQSQAVELRTELEYDVLSKETEGYSGSDIKLVCREAAMRPVRKIFSVLENHQSDSSHLPGIQLDTVTTADFLDVLAHTKPSVKNLTQRYSAWQKEFESV
uniref:katanin p60 ATPase-containing subunit A-like 2 isoform X7 n=1 Tax=Jaculus jaculus TaxID=51337 RepID=UPI001E1B4A5F|nr:katanin p60 ATPase-containing subunit A-like 2 isoform X7 [Jaculus jaculus]